MMKDLVKNREQLKAALIIIESLMEKDPEKDSAEGTMLRNLADAVHFYEDSQVMVWVPMQGQVVYNLSSKGDINTAPWTGGDKQRKRMKMGMVFRTEREANIGKKIIRENLAILHRDLNSDV